MVFNLSSAAKILERIHAKSDQIKATQCNAITMLKVHSEFARCRSILWWSWVVCLSLCLGSAMIDEYRFDRRQATRAAQWSALTVV